MMQLLRVMIAEFLTANLESSISDQTIKELILQEEKSTEDYINNVLLKQGEDARDIILLLAPIALRISLNIIIFDYANESSKVFTEINNYREYPNKYTPQKMSH